MNFIQLTTSPAFLIPLIVGSIFFSIGVNFITHFYRFRARSTHVKGVVKAIEKYISTMRTADNMKSRQVYYRPWVEFTYKDTVHKTVGPSVNSLRHKLGQHVDVMINELENGEIQSKVNDKINIVIGALFAAMGVVAILVYLIGIGGNIIASIAMPILFWYIGHMISGSMLTGVSAIIKDIKEDGPKNNSTMIETKKDYAAEISNHNLWGNIFGIILLIAALWAMNHTYSQLPADTISYVKSDFSGFWSELTAGKRSESEEKTIALFGIGLFFFLTSLWSLCFTNLKFRSPGF